MPFFCGGGGERWKCESDFGNKPGKDCEPPFADMVRVGGLDCCSQIPS